MDALQGRQKPFIPIGRNHTSPLTGEGDCPCSPHPLTRCRHERRLAVQALAVL
jgi:hypothetical protein